MKCEVETRRPMNSFERAMRRGGDAGEGDSMGKFIGSWRQREQIVPGADTYFGSGPNIQIT